MLFRSYTLLILALFLLPASAAESAPDAELKDEVAAFLEVFRAALVARDFDTLETLLSDDFSYKEPEVPAMSKEDLLERERRGASGGPSSEISYQVVAAKELEGLIESEVQFEFQTKLPKDDSVVVFSGLIAQDVSLIRTVDGLLFRSVEVKSQTLFRNGEPAGAEAIEEMHAGDEAHR